MEATWFGIIGFMLSAYVVLDGFDFGAGIIHLLVAKSDDERRTVLGSIAPVWDGNEVWLVASGGVLVFAFPKAYAAALSGLYLPIMMVLWLIILRGLSIELRSLQESPLWRSFWDAGFALSSSVIALVLGISLGNLVRGLPIDDSGYFHMPLFTDFLTIHELGAIDWYTLATGVFSLMVLASHGAAYVGWKSEGAVQTRAILLGRRAAWATAIVLLPLTFLTHLVNPKLFPSLLSRLWAWPLALVAALGLLFALRGFARSRARDAFFGSSALIVGLLGSTAAALYPTILRSSLEDRFSLTAINSATAHHSLLIGLVWWTPAMLIALGYFTYLFRKMGGPKNGGHSTTY